MPTEDYKLADQPATERTTYRMTNLYCSNCDEKYIEIHIKLGLRIGDHPCPNCKCYGVLFKGLGRVGGSLSDMCGSSSSAKM